MFIPAQLEKQKAIVEVSPTTLGPRSLARVDLEGLLGSARGWEINPSIISILFAMKHKKMWELDVFVKIKIR